MSNPIDLEVAIARARTSNARSRMVRVKRRLSNAGNPTDVIDRAIAALDVALANIQGAQQIEWKK